MLSIHRRAAVLAVLPVAIIAASFTPSLSQWAIIFWAAGLCLMVGSVVYVFARVRDADTPGSRVTHRRRLVATLSIFVSAVVIGALLVGSQGASAATPGKPSGLVAAGEERTSVSAAAPQNREGLHALHGAAARSLVAAAKARDRRLPSDLCTDFQRSKAFSSAGATIVSVRW